MTSNFITLQLPTFTDLQGSLTVLENALPFDVVRVYWIYGADGQVRAGHRHTHSRQAAIAMRGCISLYMNDGVSEEVIELSQPNKCLLIEPKDWHTATFGPDSILMVLSSHAYDRSEYIDLPYVRLT